MWSFILTAWTILVRGTGYLKFAESLLDFGRAARIKDRIASIMASVPPIKWFFSLIGAFASRIDAATGMLDTETSSADDDEGEEETDEGGEDGGPTKTAGFTSLRKRDLHYRVRAPRPAKPKGMAGARIRRFIISCVVLYVVVQGCVAAFNFYMAQDLLRASITHHEGVRDRCKANPNLWSDPNAQCMESDVWLRQPRYPLIAGAVGVYSGLRVFLIYDLPSVTLRGCVIVGTVLGVIVTVAVVLINAALSVVRGCMALVGYSEREIDIALPTNSIPVPTAPPASTNHSPETTPLARRKKPPTPPPTPQDDPARDDGSDSPPPRTDSRAPHNPFLEQIDVADFSRDYASESPDVFRQSGASSPPPLAAGSLFDFEQQLRHRQRVSAVGDASL